MSVILTRMDEAIMPKKRYLETGAAVKPEASMPNVTRQRMRRGSQLQRRTMKVNAQNLPKTRDIHPPTAYLGFLKYCGA